jgi:hypothetical protein
MEAFVLSLYGLWFWLTRKYRAARYREAADSLKAARIYLLNDFELLERHSAFIAQTSHRFASLSECCRFITEELTQPQAAIEINPPATQVRLPAQPFFAPIARRVAAVVTVGFRSLSSLSSFWSSESSGAIGDLRRARWAMPTVFAASANSLSPLAPNSKPQVQ